MKRLFAALLLFPFIVYGKVDFKGSFESRAVIVPKLKDLLKTEAILDQRFRLKGSFYPTQTLQTHFYLFSSPTLGKPVSLQESFRFYAYGNYDMTEELALKLGQMPYEADSSFISQNSYEPFPYMFEGIFLNYTADLVSFNTWGAYPPKRRVGVKEEEGLKYSLGASLNVKMALEFFKQVHLHLIYLTDSLKKESTENQISRYGLNVEGEIGSQKIDYNISLGGLNFNPQQAMVNLEAGWSRPKWYDSHIFIAYHRDSMDYDPWLYDRHEKGGLMDILQWGNLTYILVGWSVGLPKDFNVKLQFLRFHRTEEGAFYLGRYGVFLLKEKVSQSAAKALGDEVDLQIKKSFSPVFQANLLGGLFIPKQGLKSMLKDQNIFSQLQLTALYKF